VRREGLAVVVLALAGSLSCASHVPPNLGNEDVISGCDVGGSTFVKVRIDLAPDPEGKTCLATVSQGPKVDDKLCVILGGVVKFKVVNNCGRLIRPDTVALKIIQPEPARTAGVSSEKKAWTFGTCSGEFKTLDPDGKGNEEFCEVPASVVPGLYKYGLEGQIKKIDPDIEVRRGGH
jgi:hypothetical protein